MDLVIKLHKGSPITVSSADDLTQWLAEISENEIQEVELKLDLDSYQERQNKNNSVVLSEWKKLTENAAAQELFKLFSISLFHWEGFSIEIAIEIKKELNKVIKRGLRFKSLQMYYGYGFMMTEEEAEVLVEGITAEHREALPRLLLGVMSSVEIKLLDECLKVEWPIEELYISTCDLDWVHFKRLVKGSNFKISVFTEELDIPNMVDTFLSGDGNISISGFGESLKWLPALLDPTLDRWRNLTKDQIKTVELGDRRNSLITTSVDSNKIGLYSDTLVLEYLECLSTGYASGEARFLGIENLSITRNRQRDPVGFSKAVEELMESISNQDHSLLNFSACINRTYLEVPDKLQKQIEVNLSNRMSHWIQSGTQVVYGRIKLMMVGQARAGKSSTIRSLLNQPFDKDLQSTLVAEADKDISISVQDVSSKWREINLHKNWVAEEMAEYFHKLGKHLEKNTNNILVSTTSTSEKQRQNLSVSKDNSTNLFPESNFSHEDVAKNVRKELNRAQIKEQGENADEKDNIRLTIWDFGGQQVFYALHHLYLTSGGMYLLVFDLSLMLKQLEEELRVINFWLNSVELHAPYAAIIMIGTRCKQLKEEDLEKIDYELTEIIESKKLKHLEGENLSFFPIDNADETNIEEQLEPLRSIILDQMKPEEAAQLNLWHKKVPLSWIYFMNHLVNKFKDCITANQLFETGKQMNLERERDIIPMLEFYKNAGAIIPFMKGTTSDEPSVSDYIVLSPEWLLKVLGSFVYDPKLHKKKKTLKKKTKMGKLIANYEKSGILSKSLLLFILNEANVKAKDYGFIIELCQEMLIMSRFDFEPKWFTIENDTFFLVPTMNKQRATEERIQEEAPVEKCHNIYLHFEKAVPIGLFERVICIMLTCNRDFDGITMEPTITRNFSMFCFRQTEVFLIDECQNKDFRFSVNKEEGSDLNIIINLLEIGSMVREKLQSDVLGKHLASSIEIHSLDEKGNRFRCSSEDLINEVSKGNTKMQMIGPNGRERLKNISQLHSFGEAAQLIIERRREEGQRKQEAILLEKEKNKLKWEYDVFLAHTWGPNNVTHDQVVKIDKLLKERKLRTWLDEANLRYFVSNDIVDGLKKSSCVLVFITELYLEKVENTDTNASREFAQAVRKGTEYMVAVVLDPKCLDPTSWRGSTVGYNFSDSLYFDFSSEENIKTNIGRLCERIEEMSHAERPRTLFD